MTPNDRFDALLSDWIRAEATEQEPSGFHAGVVATAVRTRQRPSWRVASVIGLWHMDPWAAAARLRPAVLLVVLVVLLALFAGIVGGVVRVAPRPAIGMIVYQRTDHPGNPETAYAIAADGSAKRQQILASQQLYCCPQLTPDGSHIAASFSQDDRLRTVTVKTDGTDYSVTALLDETLTLAPGLWLNATEVVFAGWDDSDPSRNGMYVGDPGQPATLRRITSSPGHLDQVVAVSPDGSRIAFVRAQADAELGSLFTVNADGTDLKLVNGTEALVSPAGGWGGSTATWSPDGSQLTFAATVAGCGCAVYVVDADGANLRQIVDKPGEDIFGAHWSPDGQWIAFEAVPEGSTPLDGPNDQVMLIHPDGTGLKAITSEKMLSGSWSPQWSPDGSRLVFQSSSRDGDHADLWTSNADGSDLAQLTHDPGRYDTYTWTSWSSAAP